MKKTLASLLLAAVMLTSGCGGQTADDAKKDASAAVDEVKEKAGEMKDAATNAMTSAADQLKALSDDAAKMAQSIREGDKTGMALGDVVPGIAINTVTEMYGEPNVAADQTLEYSNGLDVKVGEGDLVRQVSTSFEGIYTPADVGVGMTDYMLNNAYGSASSVSDENGQTIYKYLSSDNRRSLEFVTSDGVIREIRCSLNN